MTRRKRYGKSYTMGDSARANPTQWALHYGSGKTKEEFPQAHATLAEKCKGTMKVCWQKLQKREEERHAGRQFFFANKLRIRGPEHREGPEKKGDKRSPGH